MNQTWASLYVFNIFYFNLLFINWFYRHKSVKHCNLNIFRLAVFPLNIFVFLFDHSGTSILLYKVRMFLKNYTSILQRRELYFYRKPTLGFLCDSYLKMCPHYLTWSKEYVAHGLRKRYDSCYLSTCFHLRDLKITMVYQTPRIATVVNSLHLQKKNSV